MTSAFPVPEKLYGGQGANARQAGRRERLRRAALDLIAASGTGAATINSVRAAAGLNKRYFYESYPSRDDLLADLLGSFFDDFYLRVQREVPADTSDIEARVRQAVSPLLGLLEADPGVARLYAEARSEPGLVELWDLQIERFIAVAAAVAGLDSPAPRARFALLALVSGVTEALTQWLRQDPPSLDRDEVINVGVRLCLAAIAVASE